MTIKTYRPTNKPTGSLMEQHEHGDWVKASHAIMLEAETARLTAELDKANKRLPDFYREVFSQEFPGDRDGLMNARDILTRAKSAEDRADAMSAAAMAVVNPDVTVGGVWMKHPVRVEALAELRRLALTHPGDAAKGGAS